MSPEEQINDLSAKLGAARDERDRQRDLLRRWGR